MIEKHLPGADPVYMVYDFRDRLVLTQDGNLRTAKKWLFTKYDILNRPVLTGTLTTSTAKSREQMQTTVDSVYSGASPRPYYVSRTSSTTYLGYTNVSFPTSSDGTIKCYTATYYDDYTWVGASAKSFNTSVNISGYTNGSLYYNDKTRILVTGTRSLVLDGGSIYLVSKIFYDDKYRPIQVIRDLYDGTSALEIQSNKYDFTGQVRETKTFQVFNNDTIIISKYYTYDHMGRLLKSEQEIAGDGNTGRVILSALDYNELGQLRQKNLGVTSSDTLNAVNYKYNIRGWLTDINNPDKLKNDIFAMSLYYNNSSGLSPLTTSAQYNGNISGIKWKSGQAAADTVLKAYGFVYDELNRLNTSDYGEGPVFADSPDRYNELIGNYDYNGNIISLTRSGFEDPNAYSDYDELSYTYDGNRLIGVEDEGQVSLGFTDLHEYSPTSYDYEYDYNGNMKKDMNKGITSVSYNYLNLPSEITKDLTNKVVYTYDATGTKLKKVSTIGGTSTNRYYTGMFEYGNTKVLDLIHSDEGVVNYTGSSYTFEYFLKDHLGNTRVTFQPNGSSFTVLQSADYYPFGMISNIKEDGTDNKYLYNGKELQDESLGGVNLDWYDYGARFYDPQIGRWNVVDPLAEKHHEYTPYHYTFNNPILFIDPIGLDTTLYIFDQAQNPNDKSAFTADFYFDLEGTVAGPYIGSSFPNAPDSKGKHNTIKDGVELYYNNKSGHKGGTKKGLNIVDENGSRTNTPATDMEGNDVKMKWGNIHEAFSVTNRGSEGCPTTYPGENTDNFMSNLDWSGPNGTTGNSSGIVIIYRGNGDQAQSKKTDLQIRKILQQSPLNSIANKNLPTLDWLKK